MCDATIAVYRELLDGLNDRRPRPPASCHKAGGFSDFVLAFGAFNAIRRHHADAHIILMTTKRYGEMARKSGWFDEVWEDGAPAWGGFGKVTKLIRRLRRTPLDRVYDLDNHTSPRATASG